MARCPNTEATGVSVSTQVPSSGPTGLFLPTIPSCWVKGQHTDENKPDGTKSTRHLFVFVILLSCNKVVMVTGTRGSYLTPVFLIGHLGGGRQFLSSVEKKGS